jgi:hypothetical protein
MNVAATIHGPSNDAGPTNHYKYRN